jgi:hypothetical protein
VPTGSDDPIYEAFSDKVLSDLGELQIDVLANGIRNI